MRESQNVKNCIQPLWSSYRSIEQVESCRQVIFRLLDEYVDSVDQARHFYQNKAQFFWDKLFGTSNIALACEGGLLKMHHVYAPQTCLYKSMISSELGILGLFAGEPETSACSAIISKESNHVLSLIPYSAGLGTDKSLLRAFSSLTTHRRLVCHLWNHHTYP